MGIARDSRRAFIGDEVARARKKCTVTYYDNLHPRYDVMANPYRDENNDIWEGRKPHHIDPDTGCAEYRTWCVAARINPDGDVVYADASLNHKVNVFIVGDTLRIHDIRFSGDTRMWGYVIRGGKRISIWPASDELEDERIDSMLRAANVDNPVWVKVCKRAREMWLQEIVGRDPLRRYTPEYND